MARGGNSWWGACVAGEGGMCDRRDGHCSGCYASYWNAFLSTVTSIACKTVR